MYPALLVCPDGKKSNSERFKSQSQTTSCEQLEKEKNKAEDDHAALVATQEELQREKATTVVLAVQNEQLKKHVAHQKSENEQLKSEVLNRKEDNVTLLNLAWQAKYALEDERAARKAGAKWKETFLHILFWNETFMHIPFWFMLS